MTSEERVYSWSTGKAELQTASPLVSLVAFGRTDDAVELWREDGGDRGVLMRLVITAAGHDQRGSAQSLAAMLTDTELFFVSRMAHKVKDSGRLYEVLNAVRSAKK